MAFNSKGGIVQSKKSEFFVADMYGAIPEIIDQSRIGSSAQYNILLHFVRTPVRLTKDLQIEADLLDSWVVDKNHQKYKLIFKKNQKYSDGSAIAAEDFYKLVKWQIKRKSAIHFDFSSILKISLASEYEVDIFFSKSNPAFIRQLVHPEFGIVKKIDENPSIKNFIVSSGPYFMTMSSNKKIEMQKNIFFPSEIKFPEKIRWIASAGLQQLEGLLNGSIDFSLPSQNFGIDEHNKLVNSGKINFFDPHMGFTFFLAINPNSEIFQNLEDRLNLLRLLKKIKLNFNEKSPIWDYANQLYLKGGLGRPKEEAIGLFWKNLGSNSVFKTNKKIKILMSDSFLFQKEILNFLNENDISTQLTTYKNFEEYESYIKNETYDITQVNNDFSSVELIENILVTFRKTRPLIFLDKKDNKLENMIDKMQSVELPEEKSMVVESIGMEILRQGLIFPIAYYKKFIYGQKDISFNYLSKLYPDPRLYKLEVVR